MGACHLLQRRRLVAGRGGHHRRHAEGVRDVVCALTPRGELPVTELANTRGKVAPKPEPFPERAFVCRPGNVADNAGNFSLAPSVAEA